MDKASTEPLIDAAETGWIGQGRWRLAAERGLRAVDATREEWEDEAAWHLRLHLGIWAESLRVGLLTAPEAIEALRGLCMETERLFDLG